MTKIYDIYPELFCSMFDDSTKNLPDLFWQVFSSINTKWRLPTLSEGEDYVLSLLKRMYVARDTHDEEANHLAFENGWSENLQLVKEYGVGAETLRPRYFRESKFLRFSKRIIIPENLNLEYDLFTLSRILFFYRYLADFDFVYEFGCGSCGNLLLLSQMFSDKSYAGFDWTDSSVALARQLGKEIGSSISGQLFNFLRPDTSVKLSSYTAVLTIHALEQIGSNFDRWIDYLLAEKPGIVINYEPMIEFYDNDNLYDYLARRYSEKRGYLNGYLTALRNLSCEGRVEIIKEVRPYVGGIWHESSLLVWKPV